MSFKQSKKQIDWAEREKSFARVAEQAKRAAVDYDCVIPVSGGKDSTWQTLKCLEYGLRPLAVTWRTPGRTSIGQANLDNLVSLGVDHIDYQINPDVEARFMLKTLQRCGSTAIPMHLALFNIPINVAMRFNIPLVVWGENSAFEYGASNEADVGFKLTTDWMSRYGVTQGTTAQDWIDNDLDRKALSAYFGPDARYIESSKTNAVFLGYYFKWDPLETSRIAKRSGFQAATNPKVGYYSFADIDDDFISIHHWLKWYKFGFTRTFDNLSLEIRNNRITRNEALDILKALGDETPVKDIEAFCKFCKISTARFYAIAERFRNKNIWSQASDGKWFIRDFIVNDWIWK